MSDWITTKEASELLGVNIRTIQRYVEKGKLKAKIVSGKNVIKKDAIAKLAPTQNIETANATTQAAQNNPSHAEKAWSIPEGYLLIDRSTLESLRDQIKKLTDSVGEMQLTQKLLIEKGLNLKDDQLLSASRASEVDSQSATEVIDTPIENVAKAHEDFFGKKERKGALNIIIVIVLALVTLVVLLLIVNMLANRTI